MLSLLPESEVWKATTTRFRAHCCLRNSDPHNAALGRSIHLMRSRVTGWFLGRLDLPVVTGLMTLVMPEVRKQVVEIVP